MGVAQLFGHGLDRLTGAQPGLRQCHAPVAQVVGRGLTDHVAKRDGKRRARHAGARGQARQRPALARRIVHGDQGARQTRVRHAGDKAGAHAGLLRVVEQPAQQLDHHHLEDPVHQQPVAAAWAIGFGKQQLQRQPQAFHARQRQRDQRRQCARQRVLGPAFEVQPGTGEVRALIRRVVKVVRERARVQQQRGLLEVQRLRHLARARMADRQLAAAQHVQVAMPFARIEVVQTTQRAGVVQARPQAKALQDARQAVEGWGRLH